MHDDSAIQRVHFDYPLLIAMILLTVLGLTMVLSASAVLAQEKYGSSFYFFKRMVLFAAIGWGIAAWLLCQNYTRFRRWVFPMLGVSLFLLCMTVFSPLGVSVGGAKRWIGIAGFVFQPSELAKIAILLFLAVSLEKKEERMRHFRVGVFPHVLIPGIFILFILYGRDLGGAFVIGVTVMVMMFLGGARILHLLLLGSSVLPFLYFLVLKEGYRIKRILAFLNPWDDRLGSGFQIIQSFLAFNEGGLVGKGLGSGGQKLFYLPEAHTDFVFSVLGEELGLIGILVTIFLFVLLVYRGIRIGVRAPDLFGRYLAFGIVLLIAIQSLFNMAVVMGLLPTKGMVLPFIGYGGSSLVTTLMASGMLLSVSRFEKSGTPIRFRPRAPAPRAPAPHTPVLRTAVGSGE